MLKYHFVAFLASLIGSAGILLASFVRAEHMQSIDAFFIWNLIEYYGYTLVASVVWTGLVFFVAQQLFRSARNSETRFAATAAVLMIQVLLPLQLSRDFSVEWITATVPPGHIFVDASVKGYPFDRGISPIQGTFLNSAVADSEDPIKNFTDLYIEQKVKQDFDRVLIFCGCFLIGVLLVKSAQNKFEVSIS